jgi:hypothetical protein
MTVVNGAYNQEMRREERAVASLAGGIMTQGYQCGQLWGAALAAGAQAHRLYGPSSQGEAAAVAATQRLVQAFNADYEAINCSELTELSWKNLQTQDVLRYIATGRILNCFKMSGGFAQTTYEEISAALAAPSPEAPAPPVSCGSLLAQRMGASVLHQTMAAGFAGGIGLSGGGCGALGAAIWLISMQEIEEGSFKLNMESPRSQAAIERYLQSADYQFECAAVVGRKFDDVHDHAAYLRSGGCAGIIEALVTQPV